MPDRYGEGGYGEGGYGTQDEGAAASTGGFAVAICRECSVIYVVDPRFQHDCRLVAMYARSRWRWRS